MKIDRLYAITLYLLNHGRTSGSELAKHFEVSNRTIQRDIDSLCLAGIPIISINGNTGLIPLKEKIIWCENWKSVTHPIFLAYIRMKNQSLFLTAITAMEMIFTTHRWNACNMLLNSGFGPTHISTLCGFQLLTKGYRK